MTWKCNSKRKFYCRNTI